MTTPNNEAMLAFPPDLSPRGREAAEIILQLATKTLTHRPHGGQRAFYSPQEWDRRGESYGLNSILIVSFDASDLSLFFAYEEEQYSLIAQMDAALAASKFWAEQCTLWYAAIYEHT